MTGGIIMPMIILHNNGMIILNDGTVLEWYSYVQLTRTINGILSVYSISKTE